MPATRDNIRLLQHVLLAILPSCQLVGQYRDYEMGKKNLEGNGHGLIEILSQIFCLGRQWETTKKHESEYPDVPAEILSMGLSHCSFIHCQSVPNFCIHQPPSLRDRESPTRVPLHQASSHLLSLSSYKSFLFFLIFFFSHPQSLLFSSPSCTFILIYSSTDIVTGYGLEDRGYIPDMSHGFFS